MFLGIELIINPGCKCKVMAENEKPPGLEGGFYSICNLLLFLRVSQFAMEPTITKVN